MTEAGAGAVLVMVLAHCTYLLWPQEPNQMKEVGRSQPGKSGVVGLAFGNEHGEG